MATTLNEDLNVVANSDLEISYMDGDLDIIQKLDDEPNDVGGLTSDQLKAKFDEAGNIIKKYLNETLIPAILASDATEATRTDAENQRVSNEEQRIANENARIEAENARADAETARSSAETQRADAEAARVAAENARVAAEEERETAESARNSWGDYDAETTYSPGNKVYYQGSSYVCLKECTGATPSAGSAWWQLIAHGGDQPQENALFLYEVSCKLPESKSWAGAAYGAGRFVVASGYTRSIVDGSSVNTPGKTIGSGDGENWEYIDFPSKSGWTSIIYANEMFVAIAGGVASMNMGGSAVGGLSTDKAAYSTDGKNWTASTLPSTSQAARKIAYGNGQFVVISGSQAIRSADGATWSTGGMLPYPSSVSSVTYKVIAYGAGKFVALGNTQPTGGSSGVDLGETGPTNVAAYSADGKTWTAVTLPKSGYWDAITYDETLGRFVAAAGTCVLYSDDGITWTATTSPIDIGAVIAANGRFVAIPTSSSSAGAYSDDGITWTETVLPEEKSWKSLVYGNGKFYAFASSDTYAVSEDGITWTGDVHEIRNNRGEDITDRVKSVLGIA